MVACVLCNEQPIVYFAVSNLSTQTQATEDVGHRIQLKIGLLDG